VETITPYWFAWIDQRWPFRRFLLGMLIFVVLAFMFSAMLGLSREISTTANGQVRLGICLFFASVNATAMVGTMSIIARSQLALDQLRPLLGMDDEQFGHLRAALSGAPARQLWLISIISLGIGALHSVLINSTGSGAEISIPIIGSSLGTMLTWFIQVHAINALVRNAHMFTRLGRENLLLDVLRPEQLAPFGMLALLPSLMLMGTQLYYPLLSLNGQFNVFGTLPGFLLTLISAIYLLLRPAWPVHVHMREAKTSLLASTEAAIARWRETNPDRNFTPDAVGELLPILAFREHVRALPDWPFNLGLLGRWLFYIVIPPLTWMLAALMENFIDTIVA
jgi:hypothetical protein